jgi:hypothetical protein
MSTRFIAPNAPRQPTWYWNTCFSVTEALYQDRPARSQSKTTVARNQVRLCSFIFSPFVYILFMHFSAPRLLLPCVLLLSARTSLFAVQVIPLSVDELASQSDLVVHATVKTKSCDRTAEGRIFTRVTLEVTDVWKGRLATNHLQVLHGGGTIGNVRSEVSCQVEYTPGEEVVAFLVFNPRGDAITLGLAQGKFHVWKDPLTGEKFVHNLCHGAPEKPAFGTPAEKLPFKALASQVKGGPR